MTTYSLAQTGLQSGYVTPTEILTASDDVVPVVGTTLVVGTAGGMYNAMQQNTPFLAKRPDGSTIWVTYDAERSTPTVPIFKPVSG